MNRTVRAFVATAALAAAVLAGGCGGKAGSAPAAPIPPPTQAAPAGSSVISEDILAREPLANTAAVKHILISWKDLGDAFGGRLHPSAANRSKSEAEDLVRSLVKQLQDGADFDTLMKTSSEDTGSAASGHTFTVTPDAQLVIEFRQLSLRLKPGELGVVQSDFGFHIIKRFT